MTDFDPSVAVPTWGVGSERNVEWKAARNADAFALPFHSLMDLLSRVAWPIIETVEKVTKGD